MTYWLEGTGRTQWSEIQPQLEGMTCAWADLDGFHVEAVPREQPVTTHLWGWAPDRWVRVRVDPAFCVAGFLSAERTSR